MLAELNTAFSDYLKSIGFVQSRPNCETTVGTFRKETIRDATQAEIEAWHYLMAYETDSMRLVCGQCITSARNRLKDKEIILELVE